MNFWWRSDAISISICWNLNNYAIFESLDHNFWTPETAVLLPLYVPNSRLSTNSLLAIKQTEYLGAAEDEYKIKLIRTTHYVPFI